MILVFLLLNGLRTTAACGGLFAGLFPGLSPPSYAGYAPPVPAVPPVAPVAPVAPAAPALPSAPVFSAPFSPPAFPQGPIVGGQAQVGAQFPGFPSPMGQLAMPGFPSFNPSLSGQAQTGFPGQAPLSQNTLLQPPSLNQAVQANFEQNLQTQFTQDQANAQQAVQNTVQNQANAQQAQNSVSQSAQNAASQASSAQAQSQPLTPNFSQAAEDGSLSGGGGGGGMIDSTDMPPLQDWCYQNNASPLDSNPNCFVNSKGFECCHQGLNDLLDSMVSNTVYQRRWQGCNGQRMVTDIQKNGESQFNMQFETFAGSDNICGRHNFLGDWMCKTRLPDGKVILLYAHPVANGFTLDSRSDTYQAVKTTPNGTNYILPTFFI